MGGDGRIAIVGGGIGGLAAARALSLAGRRSVVLEQASKFAEIGAGIQMGPNGFRMLETLGLRDVIDDVAVFPDDLIVMDGMTAKEITRIPVAGAFRERFGQPYALVHRADLHRALLDRCSGDPLVELRPNSTVTGHSECTDGVTVSGENFTVEADALIGADGLWSLTRERIVGDGSPRVSGHIAYRAVLPIEDVEERFRRNAMILWAGPRNHLVQYPLRGGKLFNLVAVFHSDRYVEGWDRTGDPEELHRRFAGNCDTVRSLLAKVETWRMWVLCDREPVAQWSSGRVTLLGDAAHPMLQYLAQGASMAFEDAVVLTRSVLANGPDIPTAFAQYERERYLRTGQCQIMARVYGAFYHAEGVSRELATHFLQARSVEQSLESLAWLYDFDPGPIVGQTASKLPAAV
jgi:2-polyprenyl-6-methoxyphenol hydroxylase-like FAD-dependent oxidoreductase